MKNEGTQDTVFIHFKVYILQWPTAVIVVAIIAVHSQCTWYQCKVLFKIVVYVFVRRVDLLLRFILFLIVYFVFSLRMKFK